VPTVPPPPPPGLPASSTPSLPPLNLAPDGSPLTYRTAKAGPDAAHWLQAEIEELDRLIDSDTILPIHYADQPADRRSDTTYYNPQTKQKRDAEGHITYRIRGTAGGDKINYRGPTAAQTADMPVVKLLLHSVISDNANWMTIDIKDFYLGTPLLRPEYVRIPARLLPPATIAHHNLAPFITNGSALFQVSKGMYGLPQAGLLAQQRLIKHLAAHGYIQTQTACLFAHTTNGTVFTLVVDDFGVKYTTRAGADHLIATLQLLYQIKTNWTGTSYIGFNIAFDTTRQTVTLSMPGYIAKVLKRFNIPATASAASPAVYTPPSYGAPLQEPTVDKTQLLNAAAIKTLQEQVGCLLYYARGVDCTILPAVTNISSRQAHPTQAVAAAMTRLLHYCARYPDNQLVYHACPMQLEIQSDASYLTRPHARSVAGGVFYLAPAPGAVHPNGPCHAISSVIPVVVSSVAEAEYAALFIAGRDGAMLRNILNSLGYPQLPTSIFCDNACAVGIANDTITPRRTKSIDMNFHWIRDRVRQGHFIVTWLKGQHNLADFFTKPLPVHTHQKLMSVFVSIPTPLRTNTHSAHSLRRHLYNFKNAVSPSPTPPE
jgi:Reverse transcriptase (RNA-dependent DNA polymerase)